ncbi:hypothetical protein pb186bvf_007937 [Paramecium bursaria]
MSHFIQGYDSQKMINLKKFQNLLEIHGNQASRYPLLRIDSICLLENQKYENLEKENIEFKSYSVSSEIICPKLKGEPFFLQDFDISKSPKKKRQDKINLEQVKQENNDLVESMLLSREIRIKNLDNIRQLMQFQGETLKIKSSTTYKTQTQTNVIIYLALFLFIFLWVFIIDC